MSGYNASVIHLAACCAGAVLLASSARADGMPLTWEGCVSEALELHPDLRAARIKVEVARIKRGAAFGGWLPKIEAETSRGRGRTTVPAGDALPTYEGRVAAAESLFAGFETMAAIDQAAAGWRKAVAEARGTEAEVRHDLREAFAAALQAQELVKIRTALAVRRRENVALVRTRVEAKREDDSSRLQAEAEAGKADFEVSRARRAEARAQRRLSRTLGRRAFVPLTLAAEWGVAPPPVAPDLEALAEASPRVAAALAALDAARAEARSAGAPFWPAVDVTGSASREGPVWPPSESRGWSTGLSVSLNLFHGLRDRAAARVAKLEAEQAVEELASSRREAVGSLEEAYEPYANAVEAVEVRRTSRDAVSARADDARAKYAAGTIPFDQWHEIEAGLAEAEVEYLDARREALDAEAGWHKALGLGFR